MANKTTAKNGRRVSRRRKQMLRRRRLFITALICVIIIIAAVIIILNTGKAPEDALVSASPNHADGSAGSSRPGTACSSAVLTVSAESVTVSGATCSSQCEETGVR